MSDLRGKVCVVTGAAGFLGKAIAERLAASGAFVVKTDLRVSGGLPSCGACAPGECAEMAMDVTSREDVFSGFARIEEACGRVDALVNAAGIVRSKRFLEVSQEEWDATMHVNLRGSFFACQAAYAAMRRRRSGAIVNIASDAGEVGTILSSVDYAVSKAGVINLTKCLAKEAAAYGVRVNTVAPGAIRTEMMDRLEVSWEGDFGRFLDAIPMRRLGLPEEVAALVAFLVSDDAGYVTGACYDVNGGSHMQG
jgi:Dehydrogenases with different specificities (related to short-chain alcohol dehydrogenases)